MSDFKIDPRYVDVADRIAAVRGDAARVYPDGSFQPWDKDHPFRVVTIGEQTFIAVVAAFYRTPEDPCPGIGSAWEVVPGRTPYTKLSELQNAETSAWGRALVAALAADTRRGIASAQEVRGREEEIDPVRAARIELSRLLKATGREPAEAIEKFAADGHGDLRHTHDVAAVKRLTAHYAAIAGRTP